VRTVDLSARSGSGDGFHDDLPLDPDVTGPVVLDAAKLGTCHPMFLIRMGLFLDWHRALGHDVSLRPPVDPVVRQQLSDMGVVANLARGVMPPPAPGAGAVFPVRRLKTPDDVEDASAAATEVLHQQAPELAAWGDPVYMAVSELCGNALQHGRHELGAYVAADRVTGDQRAFRLAVVDLGIGIPEHIRHRHPDWHDDTAPSRARSSEG
jgi:anti-sigma regulatory factor (Ser/Thr protein kinase)